MIIDKIKKLLLFKGTAVAAIISFEPPSLAKRGWLY